MFEFTRNEMRDLIIAFIVLSISFAISTVKFDVHGFISVLPIIMVGVAIGFLLHELGHKFAAMKYGYWSEFKLWPIGLLIAFLSSFIGIVFAFPGAAKIHPEEISDELRGKIIIAGPLANILLAIIFILIAILVYHFQSNIILHLIFLICTVGFSVNSFLATFNLLPLPTLDGIKVFKWNFAIWLGVFILAVIMMLLSIMIGAENMVQLLVGA